MSDSWINRVRADWSPGEKVRWQDALTASPTDDNKYIVASPNYSGDVPTPLLGKVDIALGPDGYFRPADPVLHPQVIQDDTRYPWVVAIERQPRAGSHSDSHPRAILWHALAYTDTEPLHGSATTTTLRTIKSDLLAKLAVIHQEVEHRIRAFHRKHAPPRDLRWLSDATGYAFQRLDFPATFRDLVRQLACFRRYALYTFAWLEWHVAIRRNYPLTNVTPLGLDKVMGCITTSPAVVQELFQYHVPVWFLRTPESFKGTEVVKSILLLQPPPKHLTIDPADLRLLEAELSGRLATSVRVGDPLLDCIARLSSVYIDVEKRPYPAQITPTAFPDQGTSTAHAVQSSSTSVIRSQRKDQDARYKPYPVPVASGNVSLVLAPTDKEKFAPYLHPGLADSIPAWQAALSSVDQVRKVPEQSTWPYWVPEARLLIGSPTLDRQKRFVYNWLHVREPWYSLLQYHPIRGDVVGPLKATQWREYLGMSPITKEHLLHDTKRAKHNREVAAIFNSVFKCDILDASVPPKWFKKDINDLNDNQWARLCQEITWEVSEVGFHCELRELDRYLVPSSMDPIEEQERLSLIAAVFPPTRGLLLRQFPTASDGLAARVVDQRSRYLEALRVLVSRWPGVPATIKGSSFAVSSMMLLQEREAQLLRYYCQTFFDVSGRAPVIPRWVPRGQ